MRQSCAAANVQPKGETFCSLEYRKINDALGVLGCFKLSFKGGAVQGITGPYFLSPREKAQQQLHVPCIFVTQAKLIEGSEKGAGGLIY